MEQETKICNNCKRAINVSSFVLHESHCARHIKLCLECGEPVPVREMEEHCRENHTPKPCDKCGEEVPPDQLEEHLEQSCTEVKVECKYCELEVRRGDYPEHTEGCGSRTDFCELCNQRVMLKEMNEHKAMKCGHMKAESPLRRYELEQMGLIGQDGGESDSGDEFNLPYHPHMIGRSVTPPPPYECHHDDSMRVDPHWLQTVAEACGEDNLDALLAQNVFYENMRSVRSGDHHVTSEPMRPRDSHVTTEDSSEDEGSVVREKPPSAYEDQGDLDNRLLDQDLATQLAATNEQDDFYLAQRMQEREVMGHSKTLYEERRVREIASEIEGRERNREVEGEERDRRERNREVEGEERDRELEGETEEVRSKPDMTEHLEQGEIAKELEERMVAKQMEVDEIAKKLKETNESQRLLARHLEKTKEEIDSLTLAAQLQKKDLAEGHRALWKNTAGTLQEDDESFARRLQMDEDRHQYGHTHLEEEEPRPKTPPTQPHIDDSSEKIPCQWCEKPIPFEQVMLHQQSCYNNLFGGGAQGGQGLHLSDDIFRRVETDDDLWQAEQFNVECQYCHVSISVNTLPTHEALCDANPDIHLKKVYESQVTPSSSLRHEPSPSLSCTGPEGAASATLLSVEKGPCEFCHEVIPLVQLVRHEAICKYTQPKPSLAPPTSSQHSPAPPPSSPTLLQGTTTASGGRRSLAIKFPTSNSDTTAHDSEGEEKDSSKRTQPDPIALSTTKVADDSTSHGFIPLSSSSSQGPGRGGMEVKATKKRQSPSETFDPWSGMREPVKKAPRTTEMGGASIVSHVNSVATRSAGSKSSKAVYSSTTSRNIYGANSKERGGNVLSSAAGVVPSLTKTQKRDSKSKASATVESIGTGVRKLALQSKPVTEGKSSSSTTSKPLSSNSNTTSRIKTLPAGNSKLQIAGTKVSGTISNPHSNATWVTGSHSTTTATKSVGGNNSKLHTNASRTGLRPHSIPSRSGSVGASTASTKPATTAASRRGRGQQSSSSNTVSRQQSSRGRGNGGSLSSRHSASASSVKDTKSKAKQTRT